MPTLKEANFNGSNGNHFKLTLDYTFSQDSNTRKTTLTLWNNFVSMDGYSGSGAANSVTGYINSSIVGRTDSIGVNQKKLLGSKTLEITHNADGTFPNTNYTASIQTGWSLGEANVSGTITSSLIPKINSSSTWAVSPILVDNIENQFELPINLWVSDYHNVVTISNLQNTKTIKTINNAKNGDLVQFTSAELNEIYGIDNNSRTNTQRVYLNLYTYDSNNNQIGDVQRTYLDAQLTNANPTSTNTSEEQNASVISLLGGSTTNKVIKYASELQITCLPLGTKGASITNLTINGANIPYTNGGKNMYDKIMTTTSGGQNQNIRFITDLEPNTAYTFNVTNDRTYCTVYLYDANGSLIRTLGSVQSSHVQSFTTASNEVRGYFDFYSGVNNVNVVGYDYTGVQLEKGSSATAFEEYYREYQTTLTNVTTGTFNIIVTDTRNNTATYTISKTLLDYIPLNIPSNWSIERVSPISDDLVLNAVIDCYSSTIDGNTNTPTVKYSTNNSTWTTISSSSYTFSDNKITITNLTLNDLIAYQTTGTFYLQVSDLLMEQNDNQQVKRGIYTYGAGEDFFAINGDLLVRDSNAQNEANILKTYSTSSEKMIGYYNSKPLYRRVITETKVSGTNLQISASWVSDIDTLVRFDGTLKSLSNYNYPLVRYESSSLYVNMSMNRVEKWISVSSATGNYCNGDVTIIVEYTKV